MNLPKKFMGTPLDCSKSFREKAFKNNKKV